jgi:hypothetical protein
MIRRWLCLGALLLLIVLSVPACDNNTKTNTGPVATDPDKIATPRAGGKAG